jgi:hypothetical protein
LFYANPAALRYTNYRLGTGSLAYQLANGYPRYYQSSYSFLPRYSYLL